MYFCHRMLVRVLPPAGVLAGLCYMAIPPAYWLFYSGYAQTHNTMCIMLEALLMLLTAKFWESDDPGLWLYMLLGLIPGAGFYLNFQMGSAILPCALFIGLFCWRKLKPLKVAATLAMTILGLAPMIVFNLHQGGGEHLGILGALGWRYFEIAWQPFLTNSLPLLLGFTRSTAAIPGAGQDLNWGLYGLLALIMLAGALLLLRTGAARQKKGSLASGHAGGRQSRHRAFQFIQPGSGRIPSGLSFHPVFDFSLCLWGLLPFRLPPEGGPYPDALGPAYDPAWGQLLQLHGAGGSGF